MSRVLTPVMGVNAQVNPAPLCVRLVTLQFTTFTIALSPMWFATVPVEAWLKLGTHSPAGDQGVCFVVVMLR